MLSKSRICARQQNSKQMKPIQISIYLNNQANQMKYNYYILPRIIIDSSSDFTISFFCCQMDPIERAQNNVVATVA